MTHREEGCVHSMYNVDLLRERIDLEEFVSSYVDLKGRGKTKKGLCPFHDERTPSFEITGNMWWVCYGCGRHGDVFAFAQEYFHLPDFSTSVQKVMALCHIAGGAEYLAQYGGKLQTSEYNLLGLTATQMRRLAYDTPAKHDEVLVQAGKQMLDELTYLDGTQFGQIGVNLSRQVRDILAKGQLVEG